VQILAVEQQLGTVARAIQLLSAIATSREPQTVSGLAKAMSLPPSTVHRLLQLLREQGMVELEASTRRYVAGDELYRLAMLLTERRSIVEIAQPIMEDVVDASDETCLLTRWRSGDANMTFIAQVESRQPLRISMPLHVPLPVIWGATGLSVVAMLPLEEAEQLYARAEPSPVNGHTLPAWKRFRAQLDEIRAQGYALSHGDKIAESVGVATAVLDQSGYPLGSLAITVPASRFREPLRGKFAKLTVDGASRISSALGYSTSAPALAG
jgi:DNA-binding IclR family transcriptional regulator